MKNDINVMIKNNENTSPIDYYPSKKDLSVFSEMLEKVGAIKKRENSIFPGFIARSDGFDVDKTSEELIKIASSKKGKEKENILALRSRLISVSDLSEKIYEEFKNNPNTMSNWFPVLQKVLDEETTFFKYPKTKILKLPIELAQFIRLEYSNVSQKDKDFFNEIIFDSFGLEDEETYFIKTGTFSSKFQFANAKCSEPREMGEYFHVINNFAMELGAAHSVDVVVREYIEDKTDTLTMYNGMPLRTEFRLFVDFDKNKVLGSVPYWHPVVVKKVLSMGISTSMKTDFENYEAMEDKMFREYNDNVNKIIKEMSNIIKHFDLKGTYSIDVMMANNEFYIIDMATMETSALSEFLPLSIKKEYKDKFLYEQQKEIEAGK